MPFWKQIKKRFMPALWVLLFFVGATEIVMSGVAYRSRVMGNRRDAIAADFRDATMILRERLEKFKFGLQGLAGIYLVENQHPSLKQLHTYAESEGDYASFPGVLGFGFIRAVPDGELRRYEGERRREDPGFKLRKLPGEDRPVKEGAVSFIVEALEPLNLNAKARGIDISSEKKRYVAALHARDTGRTTLSEGIALPLFGEEGTAFLLFHPIYRTPRVPPTLQDRRELLVGFAYAPILMRNLLDSIADLEQKELALRITELSPGAQKELYRSGKQWEKLGEEGSFEASIDAFERPWQIEGRVVGVLWTKSDSIFLFSACALGVLAYAVVLLGLRRLIGYWTHAEQKARSLEVWQRAIFNGADFAIITTDPNGLITAMNRSAVAMLGYEAQEVVGKSELSLFHDREEIQSQVCGLENGLTCEVDSGFDAILRHAKQDGLQRGTWAYVRKDGSRFSGQLSIAAIKDLDEEHMGFLAIVEDITDRLRADAERKESEAKLIHTAQLASLGEMSGGIAHEINNPLAMIKGKASVMLLRLEKGNCDPAQIRSDLEKINGVVDRIASIVTGLKAFSRDSAQEQLKHAAVDKILQDTLSLCQERYRHHGVPLYAEETPPVMIACRPLQVSQALLNLLNNAHDAVMGLEDRWVKVEVSHSGGNVRISVTDSGKGIPPDIVAKMMRPFFTTKDIGKGTGLGLSISKGLIEAQGGRLYYDATSANTRFVIEFPALAGSARKAAA